MTKSITLKPLRKQDKLTDALIRSLPPASPEVVGKLGLRPSAHHYAVADTLSPLRVRVTDKGHKVYFLWKRLPDPKNPGGYKANPEGLVLGEVGVILDLKTARERAREWTLILKAGRDPRAIERERIAAERRAQDEAAAAAVASAQATVRKAFERYSTFIDHQRQADKVRQSFNKDILPFLGDLPVHELKRSDIKDRVRVIQKRSVYQAFAAFSNLRTFLNWLRAEENLETVATDGMRASQIVGRKKKHRKRVLTDLELYALWKATRPKRWRMVQAKAWGLSRPDRKSVVLGVRMLLLTAARHNEVFESERRELNPERTTLTIPPERFKSDETHIIYLSEAAQGILAELPRWNAGTFLFSDTGETPARIWSKDKKRIDRRMLMTLKAIARIRGEDSKTVSLPPFILHDLRRTVRSRLSELKVQHEVKELALGHGLRGLDAIYDQHSFATELREAMEAWSAKLASIVTRPLRGDVIALDKVREARTKVGTLDKWHNTFHSDHSAP